MRFACLALALASLPCLVPAEFRPVGRALPERFDAARRAWVPLPVLVEFDPASSQPRLRLTGLPLGQALTARLDFRRLPHYGEWLAKRQAEGGAAWAALKAVLDEVGDRQAMVLTHEALRPGSGTVLLGLRQASHFQLYASLPGTYSPCGQDLCFSPGEPIFEAETEKMAWSLLKPLALRQAKNAANR